MTEKRNDPLFGTLVWGGTVMDMPAVVGSYYNGATLYVFENREWKVYAKGRTEKEVIPHRCETCGTSLPNRTD